MNRQDVFEGVKKKIQNLGVSEAKITEEALLLGDLNLDTFDIVDIWAQCVKSFSVKPEVAKIEEIFSVGDLVSVFYYEINKKV